MMCWPCALPESRDEEGWRHTLERCSNMLDFLGRELAKIGLAFNREKGAVLVPKDAAASMADFQQLNPTTRGFIVAGSPIGEDEFVEQFVRSKFADMLSKVPRIVELGALHPRAAHRLLMMRHPDACLFVVHRPSRISDGSARQNYRSPFLT